MFGLVGDRKGQGTRVVGKSREVLETFENKQLPVDWSRLCAPNPQSLPHFTNHHRRRDLSYCGFPLKALTELAWDARDVSHPHCPRSRKELQARLLGNEASEENGVKVKRSLSILGVGEMPLSDESAEEESQTYLDSDAWTSCGSDNGEEPSEKKGDPTLEELEMLLQCPKSLGLRGRSFSRENHSEECTRESSGASDGSGGGTLGFCSRLGNTTYLIRNPSLLGPALLQYCIPVALATHAFSDALQLMSLYLLHFPRRSTHVWVNLSDYRLFKKFFMMTPDLMLSDLHLAVLQGCYGHPTFLRHDIIFDVVSLYCARQEPEKATAFLKGLPTHLCDPVTGSAYACIGLARYAQWLISAPREMGVCGQQRVIAYESKAVALGSSKALEADDIRQELEAAVFHSVQKHMILPTPVLRLLALFYAEKNAEKLLCIVQDFLGVWGGALDLLELKLLLLQKRLVNDPAACSSDCLLSLALDSSGTERLVNPKLEATLAYLLFSRGEPGSLLIALQSFQCLSLRSRIECLSVFLYSNPFYGPAWRILVDETLGYLGNALSDVSESHCSLSENQERIGSLWDEVDAAFGASCKLQFHRMLFDPSRTNLYAVRPGDRIFILLMAPFFVTDADSILELAYIVSNTFAQNSQQLVSQKGCGTVAQNEPRSPGGIVSPTIIPPTCAVASEEEDSVGYARIICYAFQQVVRWVLLTCQKELGRLSKLPERTISSTQLLLLTRVAQYLTPRPTLHNTAMTAAEFWASQRHRPVFRRL